jgi:DNA-binding transcriptional LysR family regulator
MKVELRELRYCVAVADALSFRKAAERLYITQPALTHAIQKLERSLGCRLFVRDRTGVTCTPSGRVLAEHARRLLREVDEALLEARMVDQGRRGRLRVAYTNDGDRGVPLRIVDAFRARHADVELSLRINPDALTLSQLRSNDLDVGFVWLPVAAGAHVHTLEVVREEAMVALPASSRLATESAVTPSMIRAEPVVLFPPERAFGAWDTIIGSAFDGKPPHVVREEPGLAPTMAAVAKGVGIGFCTATSALQCQTEGIVFRRFRDPWTFRIGIAWRRDEASPLVASFRGLCLMDRETHSERLGVGADRTDVP